ncbi:MAG: ATP-binding protein [Polyangiaceae bacterium]
MPIRPRSGRFFLGAAALLAAVLCLCALAVGGYVSARHWADHTLEVRQETYEWLAAVLEAETSARGFIATDRPGFLEPFDAALARERRAATRVHDIVADNPAQLQRVEAADHDGQVLLDELRGLVALGRAAHRDDALAALEASESKQSLDAFRSDVRGILADEHRLLLARRAQAQSSGLLALVGAVLLAFASYALLVLAWARDRTHDRRVATLATEARGRLESISVLAAALSNARTRREVADVIVEHGMRAARADTCTLYESDDAGTALELIGDRGVDVEVLEKVRRLTATTSHPAFATLRSGAAMWAENELEYAVHYPALVAMKTEGPRAKAFWSVPLVAEGRPLGLLGVGFYEPRRFSPDERQFVETLTKHCAEALLRASRLEREDEARRWLATTLRSIGDAVIATDHEGRVTFMNQVSEKLTGWSEADARGRPLDEVFCIVSEETRAVVESPVTKVLREGTIVGMANHTLLRSRRGVDIPIDDSGAPIRGESGRVLGVVLVFRDVTQEKRDRARSDFLARAGEALVASLDYEATLATIATFAVPTLADWCSIELVEAGSKIPRQVAVAHVDESKVRFARELGERYPPDPKARTGVPEVIRSGRSELYTEIPQEMLERAARDPEHLRIIRDLRLRSAIVVPLRARTRTFGAITFVHAESGRLYTGDDLAFAEDFARRAAMAIENAVALKETDEARAHERELRREAELASRAKDEFLATVSHELRTPLNAILGWTVTLRRRLPSEEVDRALSIIERNARLQTRLIEDVLDISRIISGKLALNLGPTDVSRAISAAVETVTPAAEAKEIGISIEVTGDGLTITADADRLQQVVWNLLSNAVKFTPKCGHVTVRAHRDGSDVCISVSDTGEGIRRDALPLVFDRFQQADASTTRRHGGLGLGLAIVKQLVAAHGGTVHAESAGPGLGATFVVRLPARSAAPAIGWASRQPTALTTSVKAIDDAPRLDGLRLLVIDDEEDARGLVSEVLREQGAEVHCAASAREALDKFAIVRPDVVVSDIGMPEADGFALIRRIRALSPAQGGRTPAVALTAYARGEDAARAFAAGFQMHVTKPVEPAQLATVVANLGGRSLEGV